jgi:hypothetical protein
MDENTFRSPEIIRKKRIKAAAAVLAIAAVLVCGYLCGWRLTGGTGAQREPYFSRDQVLSAAEDASEYGCEIASVRKGRDTISYVIHEKGEPGKAMDFVIAEVPSRGLFSTMSYSLENDRNYRVLLSLASSGKVPNGFKFDFNKNRSCGIYELCFIEASWKTKEDAETLIDAWNEWSDEYFPAKSDNKVIVSFTGPDSDNSHSWDVYENTHMRWDEEFGRITPDI